MARFTRIQVAQQMALTGLIPVFYHGDVEIAKQVVKACYNGGVRVFEFTNRGDFATLVFGELNKWAIENYPEIILGVGSVIDEGTAAMYIALGKSFIVWHLVEEGTAKGCNKRKIAWCPGCGSVTEVGRAHELGAEIVKIFPGMQVGGHEFVKAVKGPMPWASIMPTGGVSPDEENLTKWFEAGVHCVGMGSNLILKSDLQQGNFTALEQKVKEVIEIIQKLKK